jgi:hypothetical protein
MGRNRREVLGTLTKYRLLEHSFGVVLVAARAFD